MESGSLSQGGRATPSAAARVRAGAARPRVRAPGGGVQRTRDLGERLGDQDVALYVVHDLVQHGRRAVDLFPHWRRAYTLMTRRSLPGRASVRQHAWHTLCLRRADVEPHVVGVDVRMRVAVAAGVVVVVVMRAAAEQRA